MLAPDGYFHEVATDSTRRLALFKRAVVGPGWRKFSNPNQSDLERGSI
jgi:hypothetical protein